ncbi:inositol monophosphatase [candidate division WOR-3 bacterium]|nr:inositol monophosphatase [candidate division WOR-3 bacterium]
MEGKLRFMKEISLGAGKIVMGWFGKGFLVKEKRGRELVTTADEESEEFIIDAIRERYPRIGVVAEESNTREWEREEVFILDPLDGTNNFTYGIPFFCVSIAYQVSEKLQIGVVYDPIHKELFSCIRGRGAHLNEKSINVSNRDGLSKSILATGFPYVRKSKRDSNLPEFAEFLIKARGIRRLGSAALDLCYVACGRFDGFWEKSLNPWDISAGGLLVREAGGRVSNFYENGWDNRKDGIIASNGKIHDEMMVIIERAGRVD